MSSVPVPFSQAYQATTLVDLWAYLLLPPDKRMSLRRKTACGRPDCDAKLRPAVEIGAPKPTEGGNRIICPACRQQLYCSQKCAKRDKHRHGIECAYNKPDILSCLVMEDTAGVIQFLLGDPRLSTKVFGGHYILEWARRSGFQPIIDALHTTASSAMCKCIEAGATDYLLQHFVDAGVIVTDDIIQLARKHTSNVQLLEKAQAPKPEIKEKETNVYIERSKLPLPPEEPIVSFQEMLQQAALEKTLEVPPLEVKDGVDVVPEEEEKKVEDLEQAVSVLTFTDPEGGGPGASTKHMERPS